VGYVFQNIFEIDRLVGIVIGCGIVIIYTTVGGMKSVIYTDILQFVLLGAGLPLALILGIIEIGGVDALTAGIPSDHLTLPGPGLSWTGLAALFVVFMLGETLVPPYTQRLLAGRSSGDVARGTLYSGIFSIPFFAVTGSIGLVALVLNPDINPNMAMPYVLNTVLPPFLKGLLFAAVISIVMSSADSFLNSAGIAFVNDVYKPLVRQPPSDRKLLIIAKTVTVVVGVMSIVFAVSIESIIDLVIHAYQYWAPVVLVPLVATIYGYERGSRAFIAAAIVGASATFI
jgi:SSS family solute:Na+ symporter